MASLILYGSSVLDTTLTTASKMSNTTGGSETSKKTTITGTGPDFAEITSQGLTVADVASIPATPTGKGWIYYPGAGTFATGNWSASITLAFVLHGSPNTTQLRAFRYRSGTYTLIGTISATTATLAKTTYSFAATSFSTITFNATDGVYFDLWWQDASADPSGDNPTVYVSSSATAGVANDFVITTSNFTASSSTTTKNATGRIRIIVSGSSTKNMAGRLQVASSSIHTPGVLPGQNISNGISDFLFGVNTNAQPQMSVAYPVASAITKAKALGMPPGVMMRTWFNNTVTDVQMDNRLSSIAAEGGIPYICLQSILDSTFNQHIVTYVGNRCNLYQFGNEPGANPNETYTAAQYTNAWNSQIPVLRGINANAAFIGGATGYRTTWLNSCKASGVIPDGVEFHNYPCHTSTTATACLTHISSFGAEVQSIRSELQSLWPSTYRNIAIGCGEYNVDWASPQISYSQTEPFITNFIKGVVQNLINANADYALFFALYGNGTNFPTIIDTTGATTEFYNAFQTMVATFYNPYVPPPATGNIYATDTFVRANNASAWGTASDGTTTYALVSGSGALSISGNEGVVSSVSNLNYQLVAITTITTDTVDMTYRFSISNAACQVGIFSNEVGGWNATLYRVRVTGSTGDLRVEKHATGGAWTLVGTATTISVLTANTYYHFHAQVIKGTIQAKIWADGASEPGSWQLSVTDSSPLAAGQFGFYVYEAGTADTWNFDHLVATDGIATTKTRRMTSRLKFSAATLRLRNLTARLRMAAVNTRIRNSVGRLKSTGLGLRNMSARLKIFFPSNLPLAVLMGTTLIPVLQAPLSLEQRIDDTAGGSFTVLDTNNSYALQEDQRLTVIDTLRNVIVYSGFVAKADESAINPVLSGSGLRRVFTLKDLRWLAEKRLAMQDFTNWTAGNITAELHRTVLQYENVVAYYAMDHANDKLSFNLGTLTNVTAKNGYLELAYAGIDVIDTDATTTDFAVGTLTNLVATNNSLRMSSFPTIKLSGSAGNNVGVNTGNYFTYWTIWTGSFTVNSGDYLEYTMWVPSTNTSMTGGLDIAFSDGTYLKDMHWPDQQGIDSHPGAHIQGWGDDQWLYRKVVMPAAAVGKTMKTCRIALEGDKEGTDTLYVRAIHFKASGGSTRAAIFDTTLQKISKVSNVGYYKIFLGVVTTYIETGTRVTTALALAPAGIAGKSNISWVDSEVVQPSSQASTSASSPAQLLIETSLDAGDTWQTCTNGQTIPSVPVGMNLSGKSLLVKQTLDVGGPNPEIAPFLTECTVAIESAYSASKTDVGRSYMGSEMTDGTNTFCGYQAAINTADGLQRNDVSGLKMNGWRKNWRTGEMGTTSTFGTSLQSSGISNGTLYLQCAANTDCHVKFTDAGTYSTVIYEADLSINTCNNLGLLYRTTSWQNTNDTFAYCANISATAIALGRGTNSTTDVFTTLATVAATFETARWYHMKVVCASDNIHHIFIDDVEYITFTDSTFTAAGNVGVRVWALAGSAAQGYFDNVGVSSNSALADATRVAPSVSLATVSSVGDSRVFLDENVPAGCTLDVQTSINGGSTYTSCTDGQPIPGLTAGMSLSGISLLVKTIFHSDSISYTPTLLGVSWLVQGTFFSTGNRTSPALSLNPAQIVGASSIDWNATVPTTGTLGVESSLDNVFWTSLNSGDSITGLAQQGDVWWDGFESDTSTSYTFTAGCWLWDTANSRLVSQNTTGTDLLLTGMTSTNMEIALVSNQVQDLTILLRQIAVNNRYTILFSDANGAYGQTISLHKVTPGGGDVVVKSATVVFPRNTYHTLRATIIDNVITVWFDGLQLYIYADATPITGMGSAGVNRGTGTSYINDLAIRALGSTASGVVVYNNVRLSSTDPLSSPQVTDLVMCVRHPNLATGNVILQTQGWAGKQTIAGAYDDIAKQSNMSWRIDELNVLHMHQRNGEIAPFVLASVNQNVDAVTFPVMTRQSSQYRNRQVINSAVDLEQITEQKLGNGVDTNWTLAFPVDSMLSIMMNGQAQTFGIKDNSSGNSFYYTPGSAAITLDGTLTAPATRITFVYIAQIPYRAIIEDHDQQIALALLDGGSGIVEHSEDGTGLSKYAADALATARLVENDVLAQSISITTTQSGLVPGQLLTLVIPEHSLNDIQALITAITIQVMQKSDGTLVYWYMVEATTGPSIGAWARSLQTRLLLKKGNV